MSTSHMPPLTAILTLSAHGVGVAAKLLDALAPCELHVHEAVACSLPHTVFSKVTERTAELFSRVKNLVYILPCGVAVRAIAPHISHKLSDPAVVVVDVGGRWATSLLSGHEGGANELALRVANCLDAEPVITTTTETEKDLIVGIGCRKDTPAAAIVAAVEQTLAETGLDKNAVRLLATAGVKRNEPGLHEASRILGIPLRIVGDDEIRRCPFPIEESSFVRSQVNLPAVAEPAALLAGSRTELVCPRKAMNGVTVAVARERCMW